MFSAEAAENACAMKVVVQEAIHHDHPGTANDPAFPIRIGSEQEVGQRHGPHLLADAIDIAQRFKQGSSYSYGAIRPINAWISLSEAAIDPTDQITYANITHKQIQRVGGDS